MKKIIKDLTIMINSDKIYELYEFSFNNFYDDNGEKYIGEMKNGLKEGKGRMYFNNGSRYEGDFKNDKMEGKGILYFNDGRYEGDFKNDKMEGKGILYGLNGPILDGNWKDGKFTGK